MSLDLDVVRSRFPALSMRDGGLPRIYLDNPGGTQVPDTVVERMTECLVEQNANLGGVFRTSQAAEAVVAEAREAMADFLNAPSAAEIVFGQNMTSLTLHLSRSLGRHFEAGDEVILSRMDHDGNVYPWLAMARDFGLEVRWLPFDTETFEFDLEELEKRLTKPHPTRVYRGGEQPARHHQRREERGTHGARGRGLAVRRCGAGGAARHHGRAGHRL